MSRTFVYARVSTLGQTTDNQVREVVAAFTEAGVDELILDPTVGDPAQVDLLAEAALR